MPKRVSSKLSAATAEEIKVWMLRRQLTGEKLAEKLGRSPAWVSYRVNGQVDIKLSELEEIADALEVDIADLLPARVSTRASHKAYSVPDSPDDELDSAEWTATPPRDAHPVQPTSHKRSRHGTHSGRAGRRPAIQPWAHEGVTA